VPEGPGEEIGGDGFEEDAVVDPGTVEFGLLGDEDFAALNALFVEGSDVGARLGANKPEIGAHSV